MGVGDQSDLGGVFLNDSIPGERGKGGGQAEGGGGRIMEGKFNVSRVFGCRALLYMVL